MEISKEEKKTKNIKMNQTTKLSISQWNAWSIQNDTKAQFIQSFPSDIIVIQETWKQVENLKKTGEIIGFLEKGRQRWRHRDCETFR